jgi:hypothetical protein
VAALVALRVRAAAGASEAAPVIDPELRGATAQGLARALVELRLPEGAPASGGAAAQERAIAAAQQTVLARMGSTPHRVLHRYATVPLLLLEIGADALRALEAMGDLVARVRADRLRAPSAPR